MAESKKLIWILHAGIEHPSPYFYNFCRELEKYPDYKYIINPELPLNVKEKDGIIYFNRLKRFYDSNNFESAISFLQNIDILKEKGWKIVWTIHNFFPIDRKLTEVDEYVTVEFIKKCNLIFTVSEYMRKSIKKHFNIKAINHGMGINKLDSSKSVVNLKELENNKMFIFTFIGNIYKYKMLDKVIDNFNRLENCKLIIAGREAKNANVNIEKLIAKNKNIIWINEFVDKNDWEKISSVTDVFISLYDINIPAFKYGFFPSNYINISQTKIKCISPKSEIINELIDKEQIIDFDINDDNGLYNAMKKSMIDKNIKKGLYKIKYNYEWCDVVKTFINKCNELLEKEV